MIKTSFANQIIILAYYGTIHYGYLLELIELMGSFYGAYKLLVHQPCRQISDTNNYHCSCHHDYLKYVVGIQR